VISDNAKACLTVCKGLGAGTFNCAFKLVDVKAAIAIAAENDLNFCIIFSFFLVDFFCLNIKIIVYA
jgi:hypothetical protein